jgi:hypothetical protein
LAQKKDVFAYFNGFLMLAFGIGGLAYYMYRLWMTSDKFPFPLNALVPLAALYAIGRGVYILKKK